MTSWHAITAGFFFFGLLWQSSRHFGHIEYVVGVHELNELITQSDVQEWELYFVAREGGK